MAAPYRWQDELVDKGWLPVLTRSEFKIILALGRHMNAKTLEAFPGIEKLCKYTRSAPSTVYSAIAGVKRHGLIECKVIQRPGKFRPYNVEGYRLVLPIPPAPIVRESEEYPASSLRESGLSPKESSFHAAGASPGVQSRNLDRAFQIPEPEIGGDAGPTRLSATGTVQSESVTTELASSSPDAIGLASSQAIIASIRLSLRDKRRGADTGPALDCDDDGRRQAVLRMGEPLGWPELPVAPGLSVPPGEEGWRAFCAGHDDETIAQVWTALEHLSGGAPA